MKVYCNGKILSEKEACVPIADHGFLYGMGLFETFRTYGQKPFLLGEHFERMAGACRTLNIHLPNSFLLSSDDWSMERMNAMVSRLLLENDLEDAIFRYSISAGTNGVAMPGEAYKNPNEFLTVRKIPPAIFANNPSTLHVLTTRRAGAETIPRMKSFAYLNCVMAYQELMGREITPGDEGLLLSDKGFLTEGIVSNLFFIKENTVATPSLDCGGLPGVTRSWVMGKAKELNISVVEGMYSLQDLAKADFVFLTNSTRGLWPVSKIVNNSDSGKENVLWPVEANDTLRGDHPVFRKLLESYKQAVEPK